MSKLSHSDFTVYKTNPCYPKAQTADALNTSLIWHPACRSSTHMLFNLLLNKPPPQIQNKQIRTAGKNAVAQGSFIMAGVSFHYVDSVTLTLAVRKGRCWRHLTNLKEAFHGSHDFSPTEINLMSAASSRDVIRE